MNPVADIEQYRIVRELLMPILADAAVGKFDRDVPLDGGYPREAMELLAGVQVLLEVIREQHADLIETRDRMSDILSEVLLRSLRDDTVFDDVKRVK